MPTIALRGSRQARRITSILAATAAGLLLPGLTSSASAAPTTPSYYPDGPQVDVPVSTVTDGGWAPCYTDRYGDALDLDTLLTDCTGDHLMLAGRATGGDTLLLLAAAPRADVLFDTGTDNTTHQANGSEWYYNSGWSWGFAPANAAVQRDSCDTTSDAVSSQRLCWHTGAAGGFRLGSLTGLNESADYERIVYEADLRTPQTVTYTTQAPTSAVVGDTYVPAATGGLSGNAIAFSVATASVGVCSISAGTVTFDHVGDCTLNANQAGNAEYRSGQAQQTISVGQASQAIGYTSTAPTAATVGDTYTPTTSGGASGQPVVLSIAPASGDVCDLSDDAVVLAHPGTCVVNADQDGTADYAAAETQQQTIPVAQATSATTITVAPHQLTADVEAQNGSGTPSGTVQFLVAGAPVGTANVENGQAVLDYTVTPGATRTVAAVYGGDRDYTGSSASTARRDPVLTATVRSSTPKTRSGWYRDPVTVTFTCRTQDAALATSCPSPVTLDRSRGGQSVTRTVTSTDGGAATVTVTGINIDRTAPAVRISGVRNGGSYVGTGPKARCVARDAVSGIDSCRLTRTIKGRRITWTATALDRAGNTSRVVVRGLKAEVYVAGATQSGGAYQVTAGHRFTLVVENSRVRPVYYNAAASPQQPTRSGTAFRPAGRNRWTLSVATTADMRAVRQWNVGVEIGSAMAIVELDVR